jgi:hypothetical protein
MGRELLFLWGHPGSEDLMLWSSTLTNEGVFLPARPREIVVTPRDFAPTALAVATAGGEYYVLVAGNDLRGPAILARRVQARAGELLYSDSLDLGPGEEVRRGEFGCPDLGHRAYDVVLTRIDGADRIAPAEVRLSLVNSNDAVVCLGPYAMAFGDVVAHTFHGMGPRIEVVVAAGADAGCTVAVEVAASGSGGGCYYEEFPFLRGDANATGSIDLSDPVQILGYLFAHKELRGCHDAADVDDGGSINIGDAVGLLYAMFGGTFTIAPPYPACGLDPTRDELPLCRVASSCLEARP